MNDSNSKDYTIRPAVQADYQYCYRLTRRNMLVLFTRHWGGWAPAAFRDGFDVRATTMVMRAGRRIGYFSLKADEEGLYLDNIQLSPAVHGRGIGTKLITKIIRDNRDKQIRLTTFSDNPAIRLYERVGFGVTQREGATVRMAIKREPIPRRPCENGNKAERHP